MNANGVLSDADLLTVRAGSESVCAIAVTFNPDITQICGLIDAIVPQVDMLLIIDNGSERSTVAQIRAILPDDSAELLARDSNLGIAEGHNCGIHMAIKRGYGYVLLLDQDSMPRPDMVKKLMAAHVHLSLSCSVSAVGPRYVDAEHGFSSYFVRFGWVKFKRMYCQDETRILQTDFLISSGSLISRQALERVGWMDESLFIDHVDTEWFLRARSHGLTCYGVCGAEMLHSLGNGTLSPRVGRTRYIPLHPPIRNYYVFRNSVLIMKRPYAPLKWRMNDAFRLLAMFTFFVVYAPERRKRAYLMLKGVLHGLMGRSGSYG